MSDVSRRWVLGSFMVALTVAPRGILLAAEAAPVPEKRLALRGYDPVSYFTEGRPEQGSVEYQAAFDDATYWFKGPEHRATFVADPDHYAPQFQGFCTVSLSRDFLTSSWGMYYPTRWDWMTYFGTIGMFLTAMFLFVRILPMISIFEMRTLLPEAEVKPE